MQDALNLTPENITTLRLGFCGSKVLLSAVEIKLFTALARAPFTAEELEGRLGLNERNSPDFLYALVALGMVEREKHRYRNVPECDLFLDGAKPTYINPAFTICGTKSTSFNRCNYL